MDPNLILFALGILCSIVGGLMLIILNRVLKQGDDTNTKVTNQGVTLARMEASYASLDLRVTSLHEWRNEQQKRELDRAVADLAVERRKTERREEDRAS